MTTPVPTVLATSGGLSRGERTLFGLSPLFLYGLELAGVSGRVPRVCATGTALGDDRWTNAQLTEAAAAAGVELDTCNLFPMPPSADLVSSLGGAEMIWVGAAASRTRLSCGACTASTRRCGAAGSRASSDRARLPARSAGTVAGRRTPSAPSLHP